MYCFRNLIQVFSSESTPLLTWVLVTTRHSHDFRKSEVVTSPGIPSPRRGLDSSCEGSVYIIHLTSGVPVF